MILMFPRSWFTREHLSYEEKEISSEKLGWELWFTSVQNVSGCDLLDVLLRKLDVPTQPD